MGARLVDERALSLSWCVLIRKHFDAFTDLDMQVYPVMHWLWTPRSVSIS